MTGIDSKYAGFAEVNPMPRARKGGDGAVKPREIVENRLYSIAIEDIGATHLLGMTVLVNMSEDISLSEFSVPMILNWNSGDDVDERVLDGVVRMCSSAMKGTGQRVMLTGSQDSIDTIAACILREYLGCSAGVAFSIMRDGNPGCLQKRELTETVLKFRPS